MTDAMPEGERLQRQLEINRDLVIELATIAVDDKRLLAAASVLSEDAPTVTKAKVLEALRRALKALFEIADIKACRKLARFLPMPRKPRYWKSKSLMKTCTSCGRKDFRQLSRGLLSSL
jgi:hypothetical protein